MTELLLEQACVPCRGGIPPLRLEEARQLLRQAPDWTLLDDGKLLQRTFRVANFRASLDFVRDAGELAETERHHPDITFGWGYATISLRTKKLKVCIGTTSSWRRNSTALHERAALRTRTANRRADQARR